MVSLQFPTSKMEGERLEVWRRDEMCFMTRKEWFKKGNIFSVWLEAADE